MFVIFERTKKTQEIFFLGRVTLGACNLKYMVRIKSRYIIAQLLLDPASVPNALADLQGHDILTALREKISILYGDTGAGEFGASLSLKFYDSAGPSEQSTQIFIIRCGREAEQQVRFAMCTITNIKRATLIIRTLGLSGSSRTCTEKIRSILCRAVDAWDVSQDVRETKKHKLLTSLREGID